MEKPDSRSIFLLEKCGKKLDFNIGDCKSQSEPKLKSKLKKFQFLTKILRKQKSKDLETICERKSCIPLQMAKSEHHLRRKPSIPDAFLRAILNSGLRPVGDASTANEGREPSYDTFLFVNARPTPESTPNEVTPKDTTPKEVTPKISEQSLPPLTVASPIIIHPEEPTEETTEESELPDVQIRVRPPETDDGDEEVLSNDSSSSSDDRNGVINIQLKDHLKAMQDRHYIIDTKMFLDNDDEELEEEEEVVSSEATEKSPSLSPSPLSSPTTSTLLDDSIIPPLPQRQFRPTPMSDLSSGDKADDEDEDDYDKIQIARSNINIELILSNKSSNESLCFETGDGNEERLPTTTDNIAAPCLYQLGLRKPRSKMVMIGPVCQPFNETPLMPTIFSEDFLNIHDDNDEEDEDESYIECDCGTTVCVIAEIRVDDNQCECCRAKTHFCGLYHDCDGDTDDDDSITAEAKYERSEQVSSYYESDGLGDDAAVESEQKRAISFRVGSSPEREKSSECSPRSSRFTIKTFYYSEISSQGSKDPPTCETTPRSPLVESDESKSNSLEYRESFNYAEKESSSQSHLQNTSKSSRFTIKTFYYSEISPQDSNFGNNASLLASNKSKSDSKENEESSNYVEERSSSKSDLENISKSSKFTIKTFYYSEITPEESIRGSKEIESSTQPRSSSESFESFRDFEKSSDFSAEHAESSGYSPKSSNFTMETLYSSETTPQSLNSNSKDLQNNATTPRSSCFASETSNLFNFTIGNVESSGNTQKTSTEVPYYSEYSNLDEEIIGDLQKSSDSDSPMPLSSEISSKATNFDVYCAQSAKTNIDFDSTVPQSTEEEEEEIMSEKSANLKVNQLADFCGFYTSQFRYDSTYEESDDDDESVMIVKLINSEKKLIQLSDGISKSSDKYQDTCGLYTNSNGIVLNYHHKQDLNSGATRKRNFRRHSTPLNGCERVTKKFGFCTDNNYIKNNNNDVISDGETDEI